MTERTRKLIDILIQFAIATVIGVVLFLLFYYFSNTDLENKTRVCNASFISGFIVFGLGGFQIIGNQGTFDLVGYGFSNLISVMKKTGEKKYKDPVEYRDARIEKRKRDKFNFLPIFAVAVVFFVIALITFLI